MIDNFAPQPYPLEASSAEGIWLLVIGWQRTADGQRVTPVVAPPDGGLTTVLDGVLRYRLADTRPVVQPAHVAAPAVQPARRERPA